MSAFEPLIRIGRTGYPYWLIAAVFISALSAFIAHRKTKEPVVATAVAQMGATCAFLFLILGIYVQITSKAMSFTELLPASFLVALGFSASLLIWVWSKEKVGVGMSILTVVLPTVLFTPFLAFALIIFPPAIAAHFK